MPPRSKTSTPAPALVSPPRTSGLVGKYCRSMRLMGQVLTDVGDGAYLIQPYDKNGVPVSGQRLVHIEAMYDDAPSLGYLFFGSIKEMVDSKGPGAGVNTMDTVSTSKADVKPNATNSNAGEALDPPPKMPTKDTPPREPVVDKTGDKAERALASLQLLVGQHNIVSVGLAKLAPPSKPRLLVEVDGDPADAKSAIPKDVHGIEVEFVENTKSAKAEKMEAPKSNAAVDDTPY